MTDTDDIRHDEMECPAPGMASPAFSPLLKVAGFAVGNLWIAFLSMSARISSIAVWVSRPRHG